MKRALFFTFTAMSLFWPRAARADGCSEDHECKRGRQCVAGQCVRAERCDRDTDCPGELVCEAQHCVADQVAAAEPISVPGDDAAAEAPAAIEDDAGGAFDDFPQRTVDQPIALPHGRRFLEASLMMLADSSGREEITFGEWVLAHTRAVIGHRGWEIHADLDLKVIRDYEDAPTLWGASIEVDRVVAEHVKVGAQLFTWFPTEDYAQVGAFGGAMWQRKIGSKTRLGFRGGLTAVDADGSGSVYAQGGALWERQLSDPLALQVSADLRAPLSGDDDALPWVQVSLNYWTEDMWLLSGGVFASEPQGQLFAGVGRVY